MKERIIFDEPYDEYDARSWKNFWLMLKVTISIVVGSFILLIINEFIFTFIMFFCMGSFLITNIATIIFFSTFTIYYYYRAKKRHRIKIIKINDVVIIEIGQDRYKAKNVLYNNNPLKEKIIIPYHNGNDNSRKIKYNVGGIGPNTKRILLKYIPEM